MPLTQKQIESAKPSKAVYNMTEKEFTISRAFNAPRKLVFDAWTSPELMAKWWGPKGFTVGKSEMDLKVGGTYHYSLKAQDGLEMWGKFVFREIKEPEKLVFINSFSDAEGGTTRHPFSTTWPLEMFSTFTFNEAGGKTAVTIKWSPHNPSDIERQTFEAGMDSMKMGWTGTLDRFTEFLDNAVK